jgi:Ca2+-binding EF-hand superfamily protein
VHQLSAIVTVFTYDLVGGNENLGSVRLDLSGIYREGKKEAWAPLTRTNKKTGQSIEAGSVHIKAKFFSPLEVRGLGFTAVTFPQSLTGPSGSGEDDGLGAVDLETVRSGTAGSSASSASGSSADSAMVPFKPGTAATSASSKNQLALAKAAPEELDEDDEDAGDFTPEEIEEAFDYIDLDRNKMIGFMEIKHLLACMGELVTDEEVDMMIRMVDTSDGKGMLNFFDIYAVAKHPNPAAPKFNAKRIGNKLKQRMRAGETEISARRLESTAMLGEGADGEKYFIPETYRDAKKKAKTAEEIQAENKARIEQKRRRQASCAAFVNRYNLRLPQLKQILGRAEKMNAYKRQEGHLNYAELCRLFEIDASIDTSPEAYELFESYVHSGPGASKLQQGKINLREVLLACCAFSYSTFQQRARFVFDMYDEDGSGTLSIPELVEIMKANHFSSDVEAAKRRLAVILRESKRTGEAVEKVDLSISDFMQLAKLFPNVVFPPLPTNIQMSSALQGPVDYPALAASRRDSLDDNGAGAGEGAALKLARALALAEEEMDDDLADAIRAGGGTKLNPSASLSLAMVGAGGAGSSPQGRAGKLAPLPLNRSPTLGNTATATATRTGTAGTLGGAAGTGLTAGTNATATGTAASSAAQTSDSNASSRPGSSASDSRPGSSGASRLFGSLSKSVKGLFCSPSGKIAPGTS